jgi:hypothetical protein
MDRGEKGNGGAMMAGVASSRCSGEAFKGIRAHKNTAK